MQRHLSFEGDISASSAYYPFVSVLRSNLLLVRSTYSGENVLSKTIDSAFASKCKTLRFFNPPQRTSMRGLRPETPPPPPPRLLLASETSVHVLDVLDPSFHAIIPNAANPSARIAYLAFVSASHVLVVPEFYPKATIYNLLTGSAIEVKDPKPPRNGLCISIRPPSGHLALLCKASGKDHVVILNFSTSVSAATSFPPAGANAATTRVAEKVSSAGELEVSFALDSLDSVGLRWSPDGRWLAVWETQSAGRFVWIYTADGHLFRRWTGSGSDGGGASSSEDLNLGVRICDWDPLGRWLWIGMGENSVVGLGTRTFRQQIEVRHPSIIGAPAESEVETASTAASEAAAGAAVVMGSSGATVWQEQISATRPFVRAYALAPLPAIPPAPESPGAAAAGTTLTSTVTPASTSTGSAPPSPQGILHLAPHASHLASVASGTPTTVHVHSIASPNAQPLATTASAATGKVERSFSPPPLLTQAVLIHHAPVRALAWHPSRPATLLIHCASAADVNLEEGKATFWAHVWDEGIDEPVVVMAETKMPVPRENEQGRERGRDRRAGGRTTTAQPGGAIDNGSAARLAETVASGSSWAWVGSGSGNGATDLGRKQGEEDVRLLLSTPFGGAIVSVFDAREDGPRRVGNASPFKSSVPITGEGPEDAFDEGHSMDLFLPVAAGSGGEGGDEDGDEGAVDDTFGFKRR